MLTCEGNVQYISEAKCQVAPRQTVLIELSHLPCLSPLTAYVGCMCADCLSLRQRVHTAQYNKHGGRTH